MRTVRQDFDELMDVDEHLTVYGSVGAGVVVRSGGHLVVYGSLVGPVSLEEQAFLTVTGTFFGTFETNLGLAILRGVVGRAALESRGRVAIGAESILSDDQGRVVKLHRDGSTERLEGVVPEGTSTIDGTHYLAWDDERREFQPLAI